jgi:hypothetical protein
LGSTEVPFNKSSEKNFGPRFIGSATIRSAVNVFVLFASPRVTSCRAPIGSARNPLSAYPVGMLFLDLPKGQEHTCMRDYEIESVSLSRRASRLFRVRDTKSRREPAGTYVGSKPVQIDVE